jgi:1-acyl-sn-glycerol-3-phosphate acyltransferase
LGVFLNNLKRGGGYAPGLEHIAEAERERATVVYNHVSYSDILVLAEMMMPCGLAKASVAEIPFVGLFARALQFLFVERTGLVPTQALRDGPAGPDAASTTARILERAADPR